MSDVMIVENRLKIFSDDADVLSTILQQIPNTVAVEIPELADVVISDSNYQLDYSVVSLKDFWNDGHIFWSIPNKCSQFDQETVTTFMKGRLSVYDKLEVEVSPCHEFVDTQDFSIFSQTHSSLVFDLIELTGPYETHIATGTLSELIQNHSEFLHNKISHVMFSKEKKYFVRLHGVDSKPSYKKNYGFVCFDDSGIFQFAGNNKPDKKLIPFFFLIFTRFTGAFTLEYYEDNNKIQIYSFKTGITKNHVTESILKLDVVQNTFKRMSTRYNFERNVNE